MVVVIFSTLIPPKFQKIKNGDQQKMGNRFLNTFLLSYVYLNSKIKELIPFLFPSLFIIQMYPKREHLCQDQEINKNILLNIYTKTIKKKQYRFRGKISYCRIFQIKFIFTIDTNLFHVKIYSYYKFFFMWNLF